MTAKPKRKPRGVKTTCGRDRRTGWLNLHQIQHACELFFEERGIPKQISKHHN